MYRGETETAEKFVKFLEQKNKYEFYLSDTVWIEVIPKTKYYNRKEELGYYEILFNSLRVLPWNDKVFPMAKEIACKYGLEAMNAIHEAFAFIKNIEIFLTTEKKESPLFRVSSSKLKVINHEDL